MTPNLKDNNMTIAEVLSEAHQIKKRVRAVPSPLDGPQSYGATETFFRAMPLDIPAYMVVTEQTWNPYCEERHLKTVRHAIMVYEYDTERPPLMEITRTGVSDFLVHHFEHGIEESMSLNDLVFLCALSLHPSKPHKEG